MRSVGGPGGRWGKGIRGFTLLELLTVMVIIAILSVMLIESSSAMMQKAERANCAANLRSLYVGASGYVQDQQHWPQVQAQDTHAPAYAQAWIDVLRRYNISAKNWICPSVQRALRSPDYTKPANVRIDYFPTPFDDKPRSAYRWGSMPWFIERANVHGDGNLIIFANADLKSGSEAAKMRGTVDLDSW
jgi:prepilin-type N-terminal cleavage/methylation domain-containing protein